MKVKTRRKKKTAKRAKKKGKRSVNKDNAKRVFEDLLAEDDEFLQGYLSILGRKRGSLKRKNE